MAGGFVESITRDGFAISHDISAYSLAALAKAGLPMMEGRDASMITLSYLGSERVLKGYNVMGLAKASLEANVRYMAANLGPRGIRVNAVVPGFIDAHVHIESAMVPPAEFARAALRERSLAFPGLGIPQVMRAARS